MFADTFVFNLNDPLSAAGPLVRFAAPRSVSIVEGNDGERFASFRILLTSAATEEVRVRVDTQTYASSGWATEGVDYEGIHRTLIFRPGEVAKTIKVRLFGDTVYEPDELFALQLTGVRGAELDPDTNLHRAYVTLVNDDVADQPYLRFANPRSVTVVEGNDGERFATFRILLSEPATQEVRVRVDTQTYASSGWATEGADYEGIHRTVTFQPGQVAKTIKVRLFGDTIHEPDELLTLSISGARGAALDPDANLHTAYVTIANDDAAVVPYLRFANPRSATIVEGNDGERFATFRIVLTSAATEEVRVRVDTQTYASSGWATEGVDYEGIHRTVTFQPGQVAKTIKVKLFGDTIHEPDELLYLHLSNARGAELDPDMNLHRAYATLVNDDLPVPGADWTLA